MADARNPSGTPPPSAGSSPTRPTTRRFTILPGDVAGAAPLVGPGSAFDSAPRMPNAAQSQAGIIAAIERGDQGRALVEAVVAERARRQRAGAPNYSAEPRASIRADHEQHWQGTPHQIQTQLLTHAAMLFHQGRAETTFETRTSVVRQYFYCCEQADVEALPATQYALILFVSWASTRVSSESLRHYISHIRAYSIECDIRMPSNAEMPYLMQALDGLAKHEALSKVNKLRMPLYWSLLVRLLSSARARAGNQKYGPYTLFSMDCPLFKSVVYLLAFCGALRPSEISVRRTSSGLVTPPLRVKHVRRERPTEHGGIDALVLRLMKRKNDQLSTEKSEVVMGRTHQRDCPIDAWDEYMAARAGLGEDFRDGEALLLPVWNPAKRGYEALTYEMLVAALDADMRAENLSTDGYSAYSFRMYDSFPAANTYT
jgi:hypothetical protein